MENTNKKLYKVVSRISGQSEADEFTGAGHGLTYEEAQENLREFMSEYLSGRDNVSYWTERAYKDFNQESSEADEDYIPAFEFEGEGWYDTNGNIFMYSKEEIEDEGFDTFTYDNIAYSIVELD